MTPYQTTDEDEERRILEEYLAMSQPALDELAGPPPAPPEPSPAAPLSAQSLPMLPPPQAVAEPEDPLEAFVRMEEADAGGRPQIPWASYDAPPQHKEKDNTWAWVAAALDLALNNGESVPQYIAQLAAPDNSAERNWELRNKAMNDASARATRASSADAAELQRRRLEQAERRIAMQERGLGNAEQREGRLSEKHDTELNPDNPMAQRVRENLYAQGVQPGSLDGLSLDAMKSGNNVALKNLVEQAQSTEMAAVDAERAAATARATEGSKLRVAEGTARVTQPYKKDLVREAAGIRTEDKEAQAALLETKDINAERRKRAAAQEREAASLRSLRERLAARGTGSLPSQGHFIERGAIKLKANVAGGTGMSPEDSMLDNDLTMAGLQAYITGAGNAPNSEREQEVAGRKFRADGTVEGALQAIDARIAEIESGESAMREREDEGRIRPQRKSARRPAAEPPAEVDEGGFL